VLFKQFVDDDLGCASYLVGDEHAGVAVVVDPAYRIEQYLEEAKRRGVRLTAVLETHTHADHVSGHGRIALEHGLPVRVHTAAGAQFPHEPLADGTEIELGQVVIRTVHTPGHRPEHCAFAVIDRSRGDEPWLVLTGDSLFVGDAARPDLAVEARDGAEELFHSLHKLVDLGDGVEVYPGHVAGSLCGAAMSSKASTTIGFERRFNHALLEEHDEFVGLALGPQPPRPPNMERIVELNRGPFVGAQPQLEMVSDTGDALVLDVRPARAFADGHRPGAVNVPVSGSSFATKAAFVLPERTIVIHAADEDEAVGASRALHAVAIFDVAGWQPGGGDEGVDAVTIDELERLLASGEIEVRNVRQAAENGLVNGKQVVTICETGARAAVAASVLKATGIDARPVTGGIADWRARGGEVSSFRRCGG
jgi:glyoxylase-like metal-dependent hydrolase (beta-lactamase superfamily II)/rhodanese-related sulfurtransferase